MSTLEEYTARRLRTVGTNPCIAVMQWAYGLTLPPSVWDHEALLAIQREVAISDFLWNDIVSLRKEIDDGDIDSAIPVMVWNDGCSAQVAVDRCVRMVEESWARLLSLSRLSAISRLLSAGVKMYWLDIWFIREVPAKCIKERADIILDLRFHVICRQQG